MAEDAGGFIETERKYDAEAGFTLPDLAGLDGVAAVTGPQTYRLRAIYFDTTDFRLAAAKITLRRRTGGTDAGWHLKLPAGADSRREVHAPLGRGASSVPARLAELVAGWTGGQPLRPIARLATTRRLRRLAGRDGEVLAEVADDLVVGSLPAPGGARPGWRPACRSGGRHPAGGKSRSSWSPGRVSCWIRPVACCAAPARRRPPRPPSSAGCSRRRPVRPERPPPPLFSEQCQSRFPGPADATRPDSR